MLILGAIPHNYIKVLPIYYCTNISLLFHEYWNYNYSSKQTILKHESHFSSKYNEIYLHKEMRIIKKLLFHKIMNKTRKRSKIRVNLVKQKLCILYVMHDKVFFA